MNKVDYKKEYKDLYRPSAKEVTSVTVPAFNFLMIDGQGDPNTSEAYKEAIEALYAVSYTIKFTIKKGAIGIDYGVMPLESLWWVDDMRLFDVNKKEEWKWTAMIMQPPVVTNEIVAASMEVVRKKNPPALSKMRYEKFTEGKAAQLMHIGPFSEEGPNILKVHKYITAHGHKLSGKHHEIYLSDIGGAAPEKWKTIIRQPFS
ncbi:MAG: GyrI-like domain-containing protein [Muriicola sp.]|nr:GyrI-like domain-containing protein [Muriicola sp.]